MNAAVGVPERTPLAFSDNPAGRVLLVLKVPPPTPPAAVKVCEYELLVVPEAIEAVVMPNTLKVRVTSAAADQFASPAWLAVTVQSPTATMLMVEPEMVHTEVVPEA